MSGRKEHDQYKPLGFIKRKSEKGENVALCIICKQNIKNTAIKRLESHRRVCNANKKNESNQNIIDEVVNNTCDLSIISCCSTVYTSNPENVNNNKRKASGSCEFNKDSCCNTNADMLINTGESNLLNFTEDNKIDNSKCPIKKRTNKMKDFIDNIDEKDAVKINEALIEFLIVHKIDFNCVECKYLKTLFHLLRPAYGLPTTQELKKFFNQIYDKHINKTDVSNTSGILLISTQNNNQIISMTFNSDGNFLFIKSANLSDMQNLLKTSLLRVKERYNNEIYAVVSDYEPHMSFTDANLKFWYFKCMSQRLKIFIQEAIDYNVLQEVKNLIAVFQSSELQEGIIKYNGESFSAIEEENCHNYLKSFKSCLKNLKPIRQLMGSSQVELSQNLMSLLFDNQFELQLKENINILEYVQEKLGNKGKLDYTRATELEDWIIFLNNTENENIKKCIEQQLQCLNDPVTLMANILHPCYRGCNIKNKEENTKKVTEFLITELNEDGVQSYFQYQDNTHIFGKLLYKNIQSPITYWRLCQQQHTNLANFALKILQIPAFTNTILTNVSEGRGLDALEEEKMLELYYLLKINK